jgi:hypothetical protein
VILILGKSKICLNCGKLYYYLKQVEKFVELDDTKNSLEGLSEKESEDSVSNSEVNKEEDDIVTKEKGNCNISSDSYNYKRDDEINNPELKNINFNYQDCSPPMNLLFPPLPTSNQFIFPPIPKFCNNGGSSLLNNNFSFPSDNNFESSDVTFDINNYFKNNHSTANLNGDVKEIFIDNTDLNGHIEENIYNDNANLNGEVKDNIFIDNTDSLIDKKSKRKREENGDVNENRNENEDRSFPKIQTYYN